MERVKIISIAVICLIIGLAIGYLISSGMYSQEISKLEAELEAEKEHSTNLETQLSKVENQLIALNKTKSSLEEKLSNLQNQLINKTAELEKARTELEFAKSQIEQLTNAIEDAQTRIQELENKLESFIDLEKIVEAAGIGGLELSDIILFNTEPPEGEINPDGIYKPGQTVWIYAELYDFGTKEVNGKYVVHVIWVMDVYDILGNPVLSYPLEYYDELTEKPDYVWYKAWIDTTELEPGVYIVVLTAYDKITLKCISGVTTFLIEAPSA